MQSMVNVTVRRNVNIMIQWSIHRRSTSNYFNRLSFNRMINIFFFTPPNLNDN